MVSFCSTQGGLLRISGEMSVQGLFSGGSKYDVEGVLPPTLWFCCSEEWLKTVYVESSLNPDVDPCCEPFEPFRGAGVPFLPPFENALLSREGDSCFCCPNETSSMASEKSGFQPEITEIQIFEIQIFEIHASRDPKFLRTRYLDI